MEWLRIESFNTMIYENSALEKDVISKGVGTTLQCTVKKV
jgi:hypothetical protein